MQVIYPGMGAKGSSKHDIGAAGDLRSASIATVDSAASRVAARCIHHCSDADATGINHRRPP
jgi:hypothetical protein